ncbi:MAG: phosphoribosylformylglycinamidine synthase, partial [Desulfobacteraceae bacterium]|nr:phosphoribosylformylglycinamidine synthase [Desulfobacteraceae bacterium]MBC2719027.1 phosphoribosylformylglycinamidine synthase [Desulfobacteraceae bacterium]
EYYEHFGYTGLNVPRVMPEQFAPVYKALGYAVGREIPASAHGIYRGGLGVHLALTAMGGYLGMEVDLANVPVDNIDRNDKILFSESAGRFIVSIDPKNREVFEDIFKDLPCACVGKITGRPDFVVKGIDSKVIISVSVDSLKTAWKEPFKDLC